MVNYELCRACAKQTKVSKSNKLFEQNHNKLVKKIEEITGILLKNSHKLPQYICKQCHQDLEKAHEFRRRCIFVQAYFNTEDYLGQVDECTTKSCEKTSKFITDFGIKDELPIEENHVADIYFIKEETAYDVFLEDESIDPIHNRCNDKVNADTLDSGNVVEKAPLSLLSKIKSVKTKANNKTKKPKSTEQIENTISTLVKKERKLKSKNLKTKQPLDESSTVEKRARKKRIATDDNNRTLICDQCGNHFTCRHNFLIHQRRHTGDKQVQCELCPDKFFTYSELNRHMRKHTGEKPFGCKHCGRCFSDYSTRVKHERTHTNERPFACNQCSKAFTTSYILKNHMLVHTGERSFRCDLCDKAFPRQTNLALHCRSITHQQNEKNQQLRQQQGTSNLMSEQLNKTNRPNIVL